MSDYTLESSAHVKSHRIRQSIENKEVNTLGELALSLYAKNKCLCKTMEENGKPANGYAGLTFTPSHTHIQNTNTISPMTLAEYASSMSSILTTGR